MTGPEVLLVFPPVVYSNFGRYYPSTAMLAAYLDSHGVRTAQWDLNQLLLESLIEHSHLAAIRDREDETLEQAGAAEDEVVFNPKLKMLLAARVLMEIPDSFRDGDGRVFPASHPRVPLEILGALSQPYYLDPPLSILASEKFWELEAARLAEQRIDQLGLLDRVEKTVRLIGISVPMGPQLGYALILARLFHERFGLRVVLGGPSITLLSTSDLERLLAAHPSVDAVVQYQGEAPLLGLARYCAEGGAEPWRVPGVLAFGEGKLLGSSGTRALPKLAELPFGYYEPSLLAHLATPEVSVRQAEGCYWGQCAYCDYVELYPKSAGRYRPQAVDRLVAEMKFHLERSGVRRFCLITESLPPRTGRDMAKAILESDLKIEWNSFAMVDPNFDVETLRLMAASGCASLCIGVETVVDHVLSLVRKRATREMTVRFFQDCRQAGIKLEINLIPNLPGTTREEAVEALDVIEQHLDGLIGISIFPFEATRSSDIGRNPEQFGLAVLDQTTSASGQAQFCANHLTVKDPAMSEEDLNDVVDKYRKLAARVSQRELENGRLASTEVSGDVTEMAMRWEEKYVRLLLPGPQKGSLGPLSFNWMTGRICHFSSYWSPLFLWLRQHAVVELRELGGYVQSLFGLGECEGEAIASYLFSRLRSEGLLVALTKPSDAEWVRPLSGDGSTCGDGTQLVARA